MIKLYDYQQDLLEKSQTALAPEGARVMMQLPTGGGKTEIAGALLKDFLVDGRKAVWLTHREELAEQTEVRLSSRWSVSTSVPDWRRRSQPAPRIVNGVVILKAQTVSRRNKKSSEEDVWERSPNVWNNYGPSDLLVIDEAHHSLAEGWKRAIEQWPGRVWGLTATPWRLKRDESFDLLFHDLVTGPQISEMQADGDLAHSQVFAPLSGDRIKSGNTIGPSGDYTEEGIAKANDDHGDGGYFIMTKLAVNYWIQKAAGRQTVAYAVSKGHAANLVRAFTDRGISAASILSGTPQADRERAISDFEKENLTVLVNVAVATEGFDLPNASCVMITRPTKSLALYLQMVGRGLRPKTGGAYVDCLILDLAGNAEEHGLPEKDRKWSLKARKARSSLEPGDAPVHYCHECGFAARPTHHKCPECGADLGKFCPLCVKFRPWSRWTKEHECPIRAQHDAVCDFCDHDAHAAIGVGGFDSKHDSQFYADRAEDHLKRGELEPALADWFFAIHREKAENTPEKMNKWNMTVWYVKRAKVHAELGTVDLAEADFSVAELFAHEHRNYRTWYDKYTGQDDSNTPIKVIPLLTVYDERSNMYESLGRHEEAEVDRQKLGDLVAATQPRTDAESGG